MRLTDLICGVKVQLVVPRLSFFSNNIIIRRDEKISLASKSWRLGWKGNLLLTLHSISIDVILSTIQRLHLFQIINNFFGRFLFNLKLCLRKNIKQNFLNRKLTLKIAKTKQFLNYLLYSDLIVLIINVSSHLMLI